jgi:hypothetical protein
MVWDRQPGRSYIGSIPNVGFEFDLALGYDEATRKVVETAEKLGNFDQRFVQRRTPKQMKLLTFHTLTEPIRKISSPPPILCPLVQGHFHARRQLICRVRPRDQR